MSLDRPAQLVTVSSPEFVLGTRVMLHSFLDRNPWFDGEIIVLHSRLSEGHIRLLEDQFDQLTCRTADSRLANAVARLIRNRPELEKQADQFLSLEMLLLPGAWPRLFVDSDTLFCSNIAAFFELPGPIVACADASVLRGNKRDATTFAEVDFAPGEAEAPSFNSGMIAVGEAAATPAFVDRLFELLDPDAWNRLATHHTDQAIWNLLFRDNVVLAGHEFNFLVGWAELYARPLPAEIRMFHFNGPAKPWLPERQATAASQGGIVGRAFEQWLAAYRQALATSR